MTIEIWHNPRCSKSRAGLELLNQRQIDPVIRKYLEQPPTADELKQLLVKLGVQPRELMRTQDALYRELGLKEQALSDEQLIQAMVDNPKLIERPVVVVGKKAVIGRPTEAIGDLLDSQ